MTDSTPQKRILPARERRESAAKRRAISPSKPPTPTSETSTPQPAIERVKRKYTKRTSIVHVSTPTRSASTATSNQDEILPTRLTNSRPLPVASEIQDTISVQQYQSIGESAILAASLQRSRMQWLYEGIFKKYWTKPVRRKGVLEQPPNNPDIKSMQKLGNATITIEPHTFDVTLFVVRDSQISSTPVYKYPIQPSFKSSPGPSPLISNSVPVTNQSVSTSTPLSLSNSNPPPPSTSNTSQLSTTNLPPLSNSMSHPSIANLPPQIDHTPILNEPGISIPDPMISPAPSIAEVTAIPPTSLTESVIPPVQPPPQPTTQSILTPAIPSAPTSTLNQPLRPSTPPVTPTTKTTDPVIQMLASRAATDNNLKELMKVVATSRATPDQLKQFQAHIDEINGIVKRQETEKSKVKKKSIKTNISTPQPVAAHPTYHNVHRNSPLGPGPTPQFNSYSIQSRPEPAIKHIIIEFTSPITGQPMSSDRWLFPENTVLDLVYGGTEMTCSFLVERKGSEILTMMKDLTSEEMQNMTNKWKEDTEYYQPVTMIIRATQHRIIESIARNAKPLIEVQKYMEEIMKNKTRASQEYLVLRLPRDKPEEFIDSAVELSGEDEDQLKDSYPM